MRAASFLAGVTLAVVGACASGACTTKEPQPATFFDEEIDPVLQTSCVRTNTGVGCHVADVKGNAFGNLDLSTYDGVNQRRDLLLDYGPYLKPSLLVKNVPPYQLTIELWDTTADADGGTADADGGSGAQQGITITTDIKHTGGPILDPTGSSYQTLVQWIENGATVQNTGVAPVVIPEQACNDTVPSAAGFDPTTDPTASDFASFQQGAGPLLAGSCAFGNCHGTSVNALYLTCGATPQEVRWNYFAAGNYISATAEQSEIVRRPLATSQGGSYHEGGPLFSSVQDPNYQTLLSWAQAHGPPSSANLDPAFLFFARMVQPVLVKKGCMMAQCHSAAMFHDYRLRGGSAGSFSLTASQKNYTLTVAQMSFESDDVGASRLVRKNLYRPDVFTGSNGIMHRGGALFEDFSDTLPSPALCDQGNYTYTPANVDQIPAYCVIYQWHKLERMERMLNPISAVVYVSRPVPTGSDRPQDFDVFAGGASLHIATVTPQAGGALTLGVDTPVNLMSCGLAAGADVRRPAVSWDGQTIAFAARSSASAPLAIYTANADGTGCALQPVINNHPPSGNSLLEHDFDPAFSPPGPDGTERIVFASTRGNLDSTAFDYNGPQSTPEDPTKPNANLYVLEPDPNTPGQNRVRQLTWQLNMERLPSFMQDGRLVFTAEKREPNFYQLALRRQNLDGGDYHPLYAQRDTIGYNQATYVTELAHKDFAAIFSTSTSTTTAKHGAGALVVFNRSIGVDFTSPNTPDYLIDPSVINPSSPSAPEADFFLHSLKVVDSSGSYTSPAMLPDGLMLVSYGDGAPSTFGGDYDVYVMDPVTGTKTKLLGNAGTAEIEAVGVFSRANKGIFASALDEPNGHTYVQQGPSAPTYADITVLDTTVLASLLFQNTPTGRLIEPGLPSFDVYEELPPGVTSFGACGSNAFMDSFGQVCTRRRLLGTVPIQSDGSAHFQIPGGLPILLHLPEDAESTQMMLPRWQRETMTFTPGEIAHQAMPATFFNNLCAGCHGAISGHPIDAALQPDFLTEASDVAAVSISATDLTAPPGQRGAIVGPPFTP
jgi:hypothetical protein